MRHPTIAACLALVLSACSQEAAGPAVAPSQEGTQIVPDTPSGTATGVAEPAPNPVALTPEGLGDIVVGKASPASLKSEGAQVSDNCQTLSDKARRIYAMTDGKVVVRITAMSGSPVKTARGIGVGASEAAVRKAYPDLTVTPHKYADAPAKYLDWRSGGGKTGLRFEVDGAGKISAIHAGREPEIEYVEGCA